MRDEGYGLAVKQRDPSKIKAEYRREPDTENAVDV